MLKAVLVFCQKSAKIMLFFLKSARGLHKNAHFFPIFLNIEYYIFQIFSYIFQQQNVTINVVFPLVQHNVFLLDIAESDHVRLCFLHHSSP